MSPHPSLCRTGLVLFSVTLALLLPRAARASEAGEALPELVFFEPIWKDFQLKPPMKAEVIQHMVEWAGKAGSFRVVDAGERDRLILEKRIFVLGTPDLAKAEEIAQQAGWKYLLHTTFQGVPRKGVKITVVLRDLSCSGPGLVKEKMAANHLKALRDTARALTQEAAKAGLDICKAAGGATGN